ncbi:signal recognition particle, SRP9/SRP14 subunit [Boletus coccyginus]|nr:signal recognition particle, SRP9/SRP14 subunit [Boletus coccyginus]
MVYIASWQEYQEAAENLYVKSPTKTRYCVKWKSSEGKLVLKITDDTTCIKFKTYSSIFLNRFESLNLSLMQKMQNRRPDPPPIIAPPQPLASGDSSHPRAASPGPTPQTGPAPGGVKKKKPKKKK